MKQVTTVTAKLITKLTKLATLIVFAMLIGGNLAAEEIIKNVKNISNDLLLAQHNGNKYLYGIKLEAQDGSSSTSNVKAGIGIAANPRLRIINLGPIVNSSAEDYGPTVTADGKTIYFVSNRPGSKLLPNGKLSTDFWAVKKQNSIDTVFTAEFRPYNIDTLPDRDQSGINTILNEGVASISGDGKTLYFTACNRPDGYGDCDIYRVSLSGDRWSKPINLGRNINSEYFDAQPSITPDESRIYFVSTRPGPNSSGKGRHTDMDIWFSDWDNDLDEWKPAQNLRELNTSGRECSPFVCSDGRTLIFSSDNHSPNFGGLDFYCAVYNSATRTWSRPENLGPPLNTRFDEQFISMPYDGRILYFSSTRTDIRGSQGSLDLFLGMVPMYPRTILVTGTVVDECTGDLIPAAVTIVNKSTDKSTENIYNSTSQTFSHIITYEDYGQYGHLDSITLEVTAVHQRFGTKTVTTMVKRHPDVEDATLAAKHADTIRVIIPMGDRPNLTPVIAEPEYITKSKLKNPQLANFRGLVMEEIMNWNLYPLLTYVFFDEGSAEIPARYQVFKSHNDTRIFSDSTISGGTLNKYYHILNIFGFRLIKNPNEKIEIIGCNDDVTPSEKRAGLSKERAEAVYNYLRDIWEVPTDRMKLTFRDLPRTASNKNDSLGRQENRRVELVSTEWEIYKPIFDKDVSKLPQPDDMVFKMSNGVDNDIVASRKIVIKRGEAEWLTITDIGISDTAYTWDWTNEEGRYPTDNVPYTAQLVITTRTGKVCTSDPVEIPVLQVSTEEQMIATGEGKTKEDYSLILFPFNSAEAGAVNERVMRDYVYGRVFLTSDIIVTGHTDIVGLRDHNIKLSERRAATVRAGIQRHSGGKYKSLAVSGVGPEDPLYTNVLPEGRFYNRTVHVLIESIIAIE